MQSSYASKLFSEVKSMFVTSHNSVTASDGTFVWTSQGLVPQLNDCDEVFRNIYIGNKRVALDVSTLKQMNITLVVNAAQGSHYSQIDTRPDYYTTHGIRFVGVPAYDDGVYKIQPYFRPVSEIIDRCLKDGGRTLVHCYMGRSRSATLVLAYLMLYQGLGLRDALDTIRRRRLVTPNDAFIRELCELEAHLRRS